MTTQDISSAVIHHARRWWPVVVLPALIAAAAALVSVERQEPSYSVVTRLVVVPLVQWDETFIGTSLVRDAGNASTTATTLAEVLDSPQVLARTSDDLGDGWTSARVDRAVTLAAVPETNLIEVTARASDPDVARKVSKTFADAVLADRWETISGELDQRIAALKLISSADSDAGEAATRLQTLGVIRRSGADPTLRVDAVDPPVEEGGTPGIVVIALAALGGAVIGLLFAVGAAQLQRRRALASDDDGGGGGDDDDDTGDDGSDGDDDPDDGDDDPDDGDDADDDDR